MLASEFLTLKRQQLAAELDLIDRLLRESNGATHIRPSVLPAAEPTPAPKAERPATKPARAPKTPTVPAGYAERVADALLGGALATPQIEGKAGISYPTVLKALKGRPDWFLQTGAGKATRWELTSDGRQAAQSRREG